VRRIIPWHPFAHGQLPVCAVSWSILAGGNRTVASFETLTTVSMQKGSTGYRIGPMLFGKLLQNPLLGQVPTLRSK